MIGCQHLTADLVGRRVVVEIHGSDVAWASRLRRRARNAMSARRVIGIIVVLVLSTFYPLSSAAQLQAKAFHIGFLSSGLRSGGVFSRDEFRQAFHDAGYVEGKNIVIEERFAESEVSRLPALVAELVELKVDVIVTTGWAAAQAAKKATSTIPIVLLGAGDPVGTGLVASMARPGGNITGVTEFSTDLSGKRLQLLKETVPGISRVAVLYNASDPAMTLRYQALRQAAPILGVAIQPLGVREPAEFESAFAAMTSNRPDAIVMVTDALTMLNRKLAITFAISNRLPLAVEFSNIVRDGALMSYGWNFKDFYPRVAYFVDRILKGDRPGDLPVEGPTRFYLVINLKTAQALGLTIPPLILDRVDEVVE
jgi:putative ABC transport system substrate-binding protein